MTKKEEARLLAIMFESLIVGVTFGFWQDSFAAGIFAGFVYSEIKDKCL